MQIQSTRHIEEITRGGNIRSFRPAAADMIRLGFWFTVGMAIVFPAVIFLSLITLMAFGMSLTDG